MFTGNDIFGLAVDLINKRSANGGINGNTTAIYKARTPGILNLWQNEISKNGDFYKTFNISNRPVMSMYGQMNGFDYLEFNGTDVIKEAVGSVKNYYFEVDGEATVYIEDYTTQWNILATINVPSTVTSFTAYKGIVTPSNNATKSRIRFSGTYRYLITNYAMFNIPISPNKLIDYTPWIKFTLPSDFKMIDQVIDEVTQRQYVKDSQYKLENRFDFYINYYYEGKIRVIYKAVPTVITSLDQKLEIDEITSMSGAYFLAAHLLLVEDPNSASFFNGRYEELKIDSNSKQPATISQIIDVYALGGVVNG